MAGRGPGPIVPKGGLNDLWPDEAVDPCDRPLRTSLANVRLPATIGLALGSELNVELARVGTKIAVACFRSDDGELVGSVIGRGAAQLVDCISGGRSYFASITKIADGLVEVLIRAR